MYQINHKLSYMKFIADINVAQVIIKYLHQSGHDIIDIKKQLPTKADVDIIRIALRENRIILTHDKDFLGLNKFPKYQVGMIVIRLSNQKTLNHLKRLKQLLVEDTEEILLNSLTILTEDEVEHYPYKDRMVISKSNP